MQFVIFLVIGAGLLALGIFQMRKVRASQSWPSAEGRVVSTEVTVEETRGDQDNPDSVTFTPLVRYEFEVAGQTYYGNRIGFMARGYNSPGAAERVLAGYPVGGAVKVYYNPAKPGDAVLVRAASGGWVLAAIGGVIVLLTLVALLKR